LTKRIRLVFILFFLPFAQAQARIIHVPTDSSTIQSGINGASDGDTVLVARGHYYERINFLGKAILVASNFILDNDTATIDSTIIDADTSVLGSTDSGSVVIFCNGEVSTSVIQGFTIQNGIGTMSYSALLGGGIYCRSSGPTITHCTITRNTASWGGGIYCDYTSPTITSCTISGNMAKYGGGIFITNSLPTISSCTITGNTGERGGGIYCHFCDFSTISNSTITGNTAYLGGGIYCYYSYSSIASCTISGNSGYYGGGICCLNSSPTILSCTFTSDAANRGGGISCLYSSPTISRCTITGNMANLGGGVFCRDAQSRPTITNCTITDNTADTNGGGVVCFAGGSPTITNCILWIDSPSEIYVDAGNPVVTYSDIEGGWPGSGNVECCPMFCHLDTGNYYLAENSCCVGTGCDSLGNPDSTVDIGAFGVGCPGYIRGNANGDDQINIADVVYLINYLFLGGSPPDPLGAGDTNCDGTIDISDIVYLINYLFISGPPPCEP
jgi:hypothetical protein